MDKQTRNKRCDEVKRLYTLLKSCEFWFLSPRDLQGLGIYSQQVGLNILGRNGSIALLNYVDLVEGTISPSFNPHAIMELLSDVPANHVENCLTLQELLVFSYTGHKHGRIIQASIHRESLLLQYSQLWSFADDETAPVELFVRYDMSQPVPIALEESNPIIGSLVGPAAFMSLN
ncbi:hypothetical protein N7516_001024 [Penicillium verrucosum]|uniref:uncharacterized protein n=1 Tax=Penicillium verrucosum TaxID=60171 RepID=UPI002544D6FA|nr:uncharacterized protein N7516_001024 [Penicillium verrucosum]KAJ5940856.1 hypothetical protein N7516_001024 [Penicillium verrucosum]